MNGRVLITGVSGNLGQILARALMRTHKVIGIDRRPFLGLPKGLEFHQVDLRKKACEDLFRQGGIKALIHLGPTHDRRVTRNQRHSYNVVGATNLLEYSARYGVEKVVLLSSAGVYGPLPENSNFLTEDAPLLGATRIASMRDLITVDMFAQSFFYKYPKIETVILRPVHVVGPTIRNEVCNYLRLRRPWTLAGFDPMIQLIHAEDLCRAMGAVLKPKIRGIYNIVGPGELPLSVALRELRRIATPLPQMLARPLLARLHALRLLPFAPELLDYLQFLCDVDGTRAKRDWGWEPRWSLPDTLHAVERVAL